jgi:hypothetical protein
MLFFTLFSLLIPFAKAQYELQSSFYGLTFFDNFEFYTSWDPTYGYVHYVDQVIAQQFGMINITNTSVSWGVDTTQLLNPSANLGRPSIRLVSLQSWTHGLFILDLAHMPSNTCGVWPALWMLGSGLWPTTGICLKTTLESFSVVDTKQGRSTSSNTSTMDRAISWLCTRQRAAPSLAQTSQGL